MWARWLGGIRLFVGSYARLPDRKTRRWSMSFSFNRKLLPIVEISIVLREEELVTYALRRVAQAVAAE
jgi:hypothetical protein